MSSSYRKKSGYGLLHYSLLFLLATIFLFASGTAFRPVLAAAAQPTAGAPTLDKTLITDDKAYAIDYPADFVTKLAPNLVALGSSQAAMDEAFQAKPTLSAGNVVFQIQYFPVGGQANSNFDLSSTDALLKSLIKNTKMAFGDIQPYTAGTIEGSRVDLHEKTVNGIVVTFFLDKTPFIAAVLTAPDETNQYEALLTAIVQSIRPNKSDATPIVVSGDGVDLGQTFTTKDQLISLDYPDGWVTDANSGTPNLINLGSSKEALDEVAHQSKPKLTSGQIAIQLLYGLPGQAMPLNLDASTPENLLNGVLKNLPWKVGAVQPVKLGDYDAVQVDITDTNLSGLFIAVTGGDVPVLAGIFTAPDEASKVAPILDAIVLSVRANGGNKSDSTPEATAVSSSDSTALGNIFVASDKSLSVEYPVGWVTTASGTSHVTIANSSKTIEALNSSALPTLASGDAGVQFNYVTASDVPSTWDVSGDPAKLLKSLVATVPSSAKLGEIKTATLGSFDTAWVTLDTDGIEAVVYAFFVGKTPVYIIAAAAPGELAKFQPTLEAMIMSLQINIPAKK